jgi:serine/threonine-protein kinase RsbW
MLEMKVEAEGLTEALERIEREAASHGLTDAARYRIRLLAEEIMSNVLRHADFGDHPPGLFVRLDIDREGKARMCFRDRAAKFNPLMHPDPDLDRPLYCRKPGGLGIYLLKQLAEEVHYRYEMGHNILELSL